ncbi:DUF1697 domain-containing protein [Streptomyces alkaliterrae]|uniref:DUF1697 domain-containing protein n=1 Tax=Streptomyces alkaliterrae TaxID=2213162 RepID=A0A5P0YSH6_9ACTN|nr:DUF1697 domain-containing protein [Streptomyces alkaliterrae]MBB1258725.1 DUF1697 domain-containing protein [Streptomyces alkaliterrae]MQS03228.1 DUF1697 domain-containing protein [Streptomyces alkaliterrae]
MTTTTVYAALLRGINVGGRRKVPMADLREVATGLGWRDVRTHLASGNLVFTTETTPPAELAAALEAALAARFGFPVRCLVRTGAELAATVRARPYPVADEQPTRVLVYFLDAPPDGERLAALDASGFAPEEFRVLGREIHAWYPDGQGRSRLADALGRALDNRVHTSRNWRTVTTLAEWTA